MRARRFCRLLLPIILFASLVPTVRAQDAVFHTCVFSWEDGDPKHDSDGVKNGVLVFGAGKTHVIYRCGPWGDEQLVIEPGAVVKFAQEYVVDQDGKLTKWLPASDGSLGAGLLPASVIINGAILTDIRDDSVGGDTNQDGDATSPSRNGAYVMAFNSSSANAITGATIKYCAQFGGIGSMNITGNTFVMFGGLLNEGAYPGWTGRLVPDGVPVISENTFELRCGASGLDLRGLAAKVENNTFREAADPECTLFGRGTAVIIGPAPVDRNYPETNVWGPQRGSVVVAGNTIEMDNGVRITDWHHRRGAFNRHPFRAEIRNNKIRGVNPKLGRGTRGFELAVDADAVVEGNEVSNFNTPLGITYDDSTTTTRLRVNNNRFSVEGAATNSGPNLSERFWKNGMTLNAENNYWGDASGPYDPSAKDTLVDRRLYNPRGRGIRLGDGIDYVPFIGGTVKAPEDYLRITVSSSPAAPLPRDGEATFTVNVTDYLLRSASRGRIVISVRDADGYLIDGSAGVDVTQEARTTTIPPVMVRIPDDTPFVTVEAALAPEGDLDAARSNVERFVVDRPESSIGFPSVSEVPSGRFPSPVRGQKLHVRAKIPYTLTTSSASANGTIEIIVEERIRGTKTAVKHFPVISLSVPPGINKSVETEAELEIPLRDIEKEPKTDLHGKIILKDDLGNQLDKVGTTLGIADAANDVNLIAAPAENRDGRARPLPDMRLHYLAGDIPVIVIGAKTQIKTPDVTDWQIVYGPARFFDAAGNLLRQIDPTAPPHVTGLATGTYQDSYIPTIFQLQAEPFPARTRKLRMYARLKSAAGITVSIDSVDIEVRDNVQTASLAVPTGSSQLTFPSTGASLAFTSNQKGGSLTVEEVNEPYAAKGGEAAGKAADYEALELIPLNRYWSIYGTLQDGAFSARVTFTYDPVTDFPAVAGFSEDSLVVTGLNPLSGELEALPSTLDAPANTISTDYSTFFQTYVVASKSTVIVQTAEEAEVEVPESYALDQNYPNPFNPTTTLVFRIPVSGDASLKVYNLLGQEVATLAEGPFAAGVHRIEWNAHDLASGVYLVRMQAGRFAQVRKTVLMR